uniref:RING-type E3 ubiquitin transferase n=1 Tax=Meloidogyne incognita TaxID=6306 RepID=A0A914LZG2_MELIC
MGQSVSRLFALLNTYLPANLPLIGRQRRNVNNPGVGGVIVDEHIGDEFSGKGCTSQGGGNTSFFGNHFLMGGELYDTSKQEVFLFGAQQDLELLDGRPVKFPHCPKGVTDSVSVLNALINVRRDSVKFTKVGRSGGGYSSGFYRLEFTFDCDVPCYVQIHFCSREVVDDFQQIQFFCRPNQRIDPSERYHFPVGSNQQFNHFIFKPHRYDLKYMHWDGTSAYFPVLIEMRSVSDKFQEQVQSTLCSIERSTDQSAALILKPLKQKLFANGIVYLLQEIFGIENKENGENSLMAEENGAECIICMANPRDTMILPCRHLCICNGCAETLRYKLNNCPICRSPFKALLKIRAMRSSLIGLGSDGMSSTMRIRREPLTLFEAINGPLQSTNTDISSFISPPQQQISTKASLIGNKGDVITTKTNLETKNSKLLTCGGGGGSLKVKQISSQRMAPNRNLINSGKSLGQIELNIEHIELENLEKAKKKYSHGSSNSFIQYSPGSSSIMRRTSHSPSTARRSVLRKPSPLLSPKDSSSSTNKKEENLLEKNKLLLTSTPNLAIKMENEEEKKEINSELNNNKNEDKNGHKKQLSGPCTSTTLTDN